MKIPDSGPQWPRHFQSQPLALTPLPRCSPLHPTMYFLELTLSKSEKGKSINRPAKVDLLASHLKFTLGLPLLKRALWDVLRMVFARCVQYRVWDTLETFYTWLMHDQGHRHEAGLRCGSFHSQVLPSSVVALPKKKTVSKFELNYQGSLLHTLSSCFTFAWFSRDVVRSAAFPKQTAITGLTALPAPSK